MALLTLLAALYGAQGFCASLIERGMGEDSARVLSAATVALLMLPFVLFPETKKDRS